MIMAFFALGHSDTDEQPCKVFSLHAHTAKPMTRYQADLSVAWLGAELSGL